MLKSLRSCWVLSLCLLMSLNLNASEHSRNIELSVDGQTNIKLEREFMKTLYKDVPYESTCYKSEYVNEEVCGNETKYRNECSTIPGYEDCRDVTERVCETKYQYKQVCEAHKLPPVCRNVTKYRRECNQTPPRQECRTIPGRVDCHTAPNGEQRCNKIPPTQQCHTVPGRQECRDVPYTDRECTPGRVEQRCEYRNVPYQDCRNVTRRECSWIPSRQECRNIPYQEYVCKIVTKENKIPYTCTKYNKVPYETREELVIANVTIDLFKSQSNDLAMTARAYITDAKTLAFDLLDVRGNSLSVVTMGRISDSSTQGTVRSLSENIRLTVKDGHLSNALQGVKVNGVSLQRRSMTYVLNKDIDMSKVLTNVVITKDGKTYLRKTLSREEVAVSKSNGRTVVTVNVINNGGSELDGVFDKKFRVQLELSQKVDLGQYVVFENVTKSIQPVTYSATVTRD